MPNRLATSTSPYLLQHANNPVDWFEWGDEAFAEARRRDVPVLISVGYAACHWCHVMAHESFEDVATASLMNACFVNIKVDREERPDVDSVYMEVTQAITGRGGWPMTVFATPDGHPIYAGTYFPPQPMSGMPSFPQVLATIASAWRNQRDDLLADADQVRQATGNRALSELPHGDVLGDEVLRDALEVLAGTYDEHTGGFGKQPKFPPSMVCEWLLRHHARTGSTAALAMAERTLEAMARGGLYDQLGGGFARYSVDAEWVVPHFEKMLYDNALLLRVYAHWWRATGSPLARRVAEETAEFLLRELRTPQGGFASSLDADSPGADGHPREGAFYVWTPEQLTEVLGPDDGAWAASIWEVTTSGTFEDGASVLQLPADPDPGRYASVRARLLGARGLRPRPAWDDKVVASWNGLVVAALADAGALLDRDDWVAAAGRAGQLLVDLHLTFAPPEAEAEADEPEAERAGWARLARTSRNGVVGTAPGVLEDYADVAEGFLALYQATGEQGWVWRAGQLLDAVLDRFDDGSGGFYDTAQDATDPVLAAIRRPRDVGDGPAPAGQSAAAGALLTHAALTGSAAHRVAAERALTEPLLIAGRFPRAAGWALAVAEALRDGPREVAVVGPAGDPGTAALRRAALMATAPGAVVAVTDPETAIDGPVALVLDRPLVEGRPTAYVCRQFVCEWPVTNSVELAAQLAR